MMTAMKQTIAFLIQNTIRCKHKYQSIKTYNVDFALCTTVATDISVILVPAFDED